MNLSIARKLMLSVAAGAVMTSAAFAANPEVGDLLQTQKWVLQ